MVTKYAQTVNEQINTNTPKRNRWSNIGNAVGNSSSSASAQFTVSTSTTKDKNGKKKTVTTKNYPYTVTGHKFGLEIPQNAIINEISIQVSMKASKKDSGIEFPRGLFCIYGGGWSKHIDNTSKKETGFHNGLYLYNPKKKLTSSYTTCTYKLSGDNLKKANIKPSDLNADVAGMDLIFDDETFSSTTTVYLQWIRIVVDYTIPNYIITHNGADTSESQPRQIKTGDICSLQFKVQQSTNAYGGKQCLKLTIPYGTSLVNNVVVSKGSFDRNTNIWTLNCDGKTTATLDLQYTDATVDVSKITLEGIDADGSLKPHVPLKEFWFNSEYGVVDDYGTTTLQQISPQVHKRHDAVFAVASKVESTYDDEITYLIGTTGSWYENMSYEIDPHLSSEGISIVEEKTNSQQVTFKVPINKIVDIAFRFTLRPINTGSFPLYCWVNAITISNELNVTVKEPYIYRFGNKTVATDTEFNTKFNSEVLGVLSHRVASKLNTGAFILPCTVKDHDALMIQGKTNINMYKWEQVDYIGCVPLEQTHFDPKSNYKDKLLKTKNKNNKYVGKELSSDEDIDLNVRLHPEQVTTIQGLIDMDKPVPINANHRCFEGDALNHRGWVELYGIKAEYTNPHWYKCSIDVEYLTHNLNTRFNISKGDKTFANYAMPTLLLESVESGDSLSNNDEIDYFIINTDGGYIYNEENTHIDYYYTEDDKIVVYLDFDDEDIKQAIIDEYSNYSIKFVIGETEDSFNELIESIVNEGYIIVSAEIGEPITVDDTEYSSENQRNIFTLDEGQHFSIKSREPLSNVSSITYDWSTMMLSEYKENAVSKIIRLIDAKESHVMFEYEYCDFDFSEFKDASEEIAGYDYINCHVIGRAYVKGDYDEVINEDIRIPVIINNDEEDEDVPDEDDEVFYGSKVTFNLNNNTLQILDNGYTGKAIEKSVELEGESYYYEVEWKNNNTDAEDSDIVTYVDLSVSDSLLASRYSSRYGNMLISPFPVADKKLIFSRNAEEGVIYYYENDENEFSYLIDPYYTYHNGVDLRNNRGSSIMNLNYGYKTISLENGLVSLGINRLNGHMYLRKWDDTIKEYITLFNFQLTHYDDVNLNWISDDRIDLQASNTIISMYRGHPYVVLRHETEEILINNKFGRVWGEQVGDTAPLNYPTYWDLLNTKNMLPVCVGSSKNIDDDCIEVFECGDVVECPDLTIGEMHFAYQDNPFIVYEDTDTEFSLTGDLQDGDLVYLLINGDVQEEPVQYPNPFVCNFNKSEEYELSAVYVGDDSRSYMVAPTITVYANQGDDEPSPSPEPSPTPQTGKFAIKVFAPSTMQYMDNSEIKCQLLQGGQPVRNKVIEKQIFKHIATSTTNSEGISVSRNTYADSTPKKYSVGARYFEGGKLICKGFKNITVKKADVVWERIDSKKNGTTKVNDVVKFRLKHSKTGNAISGAKVSITYDGKAHTKNTNSNGTVSFKIVKKGNKSFKCAFAGNSKYNSAKKTFKMTVKS